MRSRIFKRSARFYFFLTLLCASCALCPERARAQQEALVTNSFFETDIREVLRDISAQTGVKIVPDETVQGSVSIEFKEVPLEDALRMVLAVGNYSFRRMPEGYYLVGLCTPNSPSFNRLSVAKFFKPNYLKAKELRTLVSDFYLPYLQVNEDANVITITASSEMASRIEEDLKKFDQPPRQIMIEALVVELTEEGRKSLGVTWGSMLEGGFSIYPPSTLDYTRAASAKGAYEISGTLSTDLFARINTLISRGQAKVKANPHLATMEGKQAEIAVGREEYYLINVGSAATAYYTLQSIATGVVLKITPYVDENRQISVSIAPEVSEVVGKGATNLPVITKRTAATSLRVNDGQTIAIGGLVQEQSSETVSKTPFLGSIPFLGSLFRHTSTTRENKEVAIFITPYLLEEGRAPSAGAQVSEGQAAQVSSSAAEGYIAVPPRDRAPIKKYYLQIHRIIEENKKLEGLENILQGEAKEVTLELVLFSTGRVHSVTVLKSSGVPFLDMLASKSIEDLSPFPPFPDDIDESSITFVVPIRYED